MRHGRPIFALALLLSCWRLAPTRARAEEAPESTPAVLATYAIERPGQPSEQLVLVRTGDRVEHRFAQRGTAELWRRDPRGELEHVKAYPGDGKSVHYTAGDLRTIALAPSWDELASLVGARELRDLKQAGSRRLAGRAARLLRGTLRGQPAELAWLDALSLPAYLRLGTGAQRTVLRLVDVRPCTDELCAEYDARALRSIEFADLGDMEYDPFVRRFLAREARSHGAHAHAH